MHFIKKYSFKAKEYFHEGGVPYLIKRSFRYFIFLAKKYKLIKIRIQNITIQKDRIKLCIEKNDVRLFWDNCELTKNIGLHTAFYYNNRCYDSSLSSKADFRAKKISNKEIRVAIKWLELPITQFWQIIINGNNLLWNVDVKLNRKISFQQHRTGFMLMPDYQKWFNSYEEGVFPASFTVWDEIFLEDKESKVFGLRGVNRAGFRLPALLFEIFSEGSPFLQNTDSELSARIAQIQIMPQSRKYLSGKHRIFSGKMNLLENEAEIDTYIAQSQVRRYRYFSGLMELIENKHRKYSDNKISGLFNPLADEECWYIYGDFAELHDRFVRKTGDFERKIELIKNARNRETKIKIGISRYNFFRLHKIIEFCYSLLGQPLDCSAISLNLFPLCKLINNFAKYFDELRLKIKTERIEFILADNDLLDLLRSISSQANQDSERELLRLLGVISEHAFIGPKTVVIDTFHRCNASCLHCWVHTPGLRQPQEFLNRTLNFELYTKVIDDFSELMVDKIIFQGDGEPLMYERIFEMMEYARKKNINVSFFTNGILFDRQKARRAVELGIDEIFCSLPAGSAKTFSVVNSKQNEDTFYTILENMKYLISLRKAMGKSRPVLKMTHVIHTLNHNELMHMAKNDVNIGADVLRFYLVRLDDNIRFLQLKPGEVEIIRQDLLKVKEHLKDKDIQLLDTTDFQLANYEEKSGSWSKKVFLDGGCLIGWYFNLLPAKGDLSLCCHLRTVGNINEKSFKEIWNSREYWRWRIQAKYLKDNKNVTFLNGVRLYDEHCEHCDTHQVLRDVKNELNKYNLTQFV